MIQVLIGLAEILGVMVLVAGALIGVTMLEQRKAVKAAKAAKALAEAEAPALESDDDAAAEAQPGGITPELLAAITIAVADYSRRRRLEAAPHARVDEPGSRLFASRWVTVGRSFQQQSWVRR
ncbi:MAG: hypothetical protein LBR58_02105 [Propionibacteriaceae bacterium]|jgi:hypothetical protein|nr:hypothetical protein [Propionibacteriaceae bacterium]